MAYGYNNNKYSDFDERSFRLHVEKALASVKRVLDTERSSSIGLAEDVEHSYADKYKLADGMVNSSVIGVLRVLEHLGMTREKLAEIAATAAESKKSTTLRFAVVSMSSTFVKEDVVDMPLSPKRTKTKTTTTKTTTEAGANDFATDDDEEEDNKTSTTTKTSTTIETIVERVNRKHYDREAKWELSVVSGTDVEDRTILGERVCRAPVVVRGASPESETSPSPPSIAAAGENHQTPIEVLLPLTWLLQQIDVDGGKAHFSIDTSPSATTAAETKTKTPYRNEQVEQALLFFREALLFSARVWSKIELLVRHFESHDPTKTQGSEKAATIGGLRDMFRQRAGEIFVPALPFLANNNNKKKANSGTELELEPESGGETDEAWIRPEVGGSSSREEIESSQITATDVVTGNKDDDDDGSSASAMVSAGDTMKFLNEHARTLLEAQRFLEVRFPDPGVTDEIVSSLEAKMSVFLTHIGHLVQGLVNNLRYIEVMLEKQLVAAIGKEVTTSDLDKYVRYHNEKLLRPSPKRFCYTIRRPEHYPDGILSIEEVQSNYAYSETTESIEPIATHVREDSSPNPIVVPLNAATSIELTGKTYVHGWLKHRFGSDRSSSSSSESIRLCARARQFSSFVLMVGTMEARNRFQPKDAIILRNKDEVRIPLLLNEIPTAKEFKRSVCSLSPEQQRFAKSFRSMQLDSSVLGVCVVQIKPQLERLLGLPNDALSKEMKLTEDLTELFVEYQVPSDLVSCDPCLVGGGENNDNNNNNAVSVSTKDKVANVREHVQSVLDVIAAQKKEQLEEEEQRKAMAKAAAASRRGGRNRCAPPGGRDRCAPPGNNYIVQSRSAVPKYSMQDAESSPVFMSMAMAAPRNEFFDDGEEEEYEECAAPGDSFDGDDGTEDEDSYGSGGDEAAESTPPNERSSEQAKLDSKSESTDFMKIPKILDRAVEMYDRNAAIRSTTIETDNNDWTKISQKNLLSKSVEENLSKENIATETSRAFDLLDALSRSGSLSIPASELHVVICATHRFEKSVMETVLLDNVNPIEKLELSTLLVASTILDVPARDLLVATDGGSPSSNLERLEASFPKLLGNGGGGSGEDSGVADDQQQSSSD